MQVKFIKTESQYLDQLPIVNGQIIVLTDMSGMYYDMNNERHNAADAIEWVPMTEPSEES